MKNPTSLVIGIVILLLLLTYMFTFQVGYNEAVYVSTFGNASQDSVIRGDTDRAKGIIGNLHFKWPWPIQDVTSYDTRVRILEDQLEQVYLKGETTIILDAYLAWRITNPLDFSVALGSVDNARNQLITRIRDAKSKVGAYTLEELTNPDPKKIKMDDAERLMLERLRNDIGSLDQPWGVELVSLGLKRTVLPPEVSKAVFAQMIENRDRIAESARSEGEARKTTIINDARSAEERILSFANARADKIRAQGREDAVKFYKFFAQNPELARLLRTINANRQALGPNATIILDADSAIGFGLWRPEDESSKPAADAN